MFAKIDPVCTQEAASLHLSGVLVAAKETPVDAEKENNFPFNTARTTHTPPILPVIMLHQHVRVLNAVFMQLFS